jgi:hypothetical protein
MVQGSAEGVQQQGEKAKTAEGVSKKDRGAFNYCWCCWWQCLLILQRIAAGMQHRWQLVQQQCRTKQ